MIKSDSHKPSKLAKFVKHITGSESTIAYQANKIFKL